MARASYDCIDCNKTIRVEGYNRADADRKLNWMAENKPRCWDCEKAVRDAEILDTATELALPALDEGTEKQLKFAESIRTRIIPQLLASLPDVPGTARALLTSSSSNSAMKSMMTFSAPSSKTSGPAPLRGGGLITATGSLCCWLGSFCVMCSVPLRPPQRRSRWKLKSWLKR